MIYIDRGVYIICYYIIYGQIAIKKKKMEKSKKSVLYLTTTDDRHDNDARLYIYNILCVCVCV